MIRPAIGSQLRVGLAQFKPDKAEVESNLSRILEVVTEQSGEVDLLVFPETSLTGYFLEGGVAEAARSAADVAERLGPPPEGAPDLVLGFFERHRRRLYNSVVYLTAGEGFFEVTHVHRKMFLPTYGVFDEGRFVEAGKSVRAFDTRYGRVGLLICEEMWHSLPPTILAVGGAELIIAVSASPARDFTPGGEGRPHNLSRWDALAPAPEPQPPVTTRGRRWSRGTARDATPRAPPAARRCRRSPRRTRGCRPRPGRTTSRTRTSSGRGTRRGSWPAIVLAGN
ncbi:MAG TPA: hypothetical protein EYQ64_12530, partial [Gemmatimonadetes bacterium]|nr:hypothetical protein [Gemmatimonadota bacterium]